MASKVTINIFYVCDQSARATFGELYAKKLINDTIEEIETHVTCRIERRNDIDLIYKKIENITVFIMEKDIILRLTNTGIKVFNVRRSKGVSFEVLKGRMTRVSFLVVLKRLYIWPQRI